MKYLLPRLFVPTFLISISGRSQTLPTDIDDLVFFLESIAIDPELHVAYCETEECFLDEATETAPIDEQYCDGASCGNGCVRRWPDQSDYDPPAGFNPPEYTIGRNFGQDDHEKPCYIPEGINGQPSVKGGAPYGDFTQDKYLETQVSDIITAAEDFSVFLLCKPIDQEETGDWFYFGQATSFLRHKVSNNALNLRINGDSPVMPITNEEAMTLDEWQLVEIHRDASSDITCFIDAYDRTVDGGANASGTFRVGYLFSNFKTTGDVAMYGEVASFIIYNRKLDDDETWGVREYLDSVYSLDLTPLSVQEEELSSAFQVTYNRFESAISINSLENNQAEIKHVNVYDLSGKVIINQPVNTSGQTNLSLPVQVKNQLLIVEIQTSEGIITERINVGF